MPFFDSRFKIVSQILSEVFEMKRHFVPKHSLSFLPGQNVKCLGAIPNRAFELCIKSLFLHGIFYGMAKALVPESSLASRRFS